MNSFAGFGWGPEMKGTELLAFVASTDNGIYLSTLKGIGHVAPDDDSSVADCYTTNTTVTDSGNV